MVAGDFLSEGGRRKRKRGCAESVAGVERSLDPSLFVPRCSLSSSMSSDAARASAFVASASAAHPRLAPALSEAGALAEGRLWHELATRIEALLSEPELR